MTVHVRRVYEVQSFEADGDVWRTCAILEHTTADGTVHFDWLLDRGIGPGNPDERRLRAFRCARAPVELSVGVTAATEPMADHRHRYLEIEGPTELSQGRGTVRLVLRGQWRTHRAHSVAGSERIEICCTDSGDVLTMDLTERTVQCVAREGCVL